MMPKIHKFKLSILRDIGWKFWDPIGLLPQGDCWEQYPEFADEYDDYLMQAAGRFARGETVEEVGDYLYDIASNRMGLGSSPQGLLASQNTAEHLFASKGTWMST